MKSDMIEEYPTTKDIEVALKEMGRLEAQEFLRDNSSLFAHTNGKQNVADIGKHLLYDLDSIIELKKKLDSKKRNVRSTAFVVQTSASLNELEGELKDLKKDDEVFHDDSGLTIANTQRTENGITVKLDYTYRQEANRNLLDKQDKSATFKMVETHEDDILKVTQNFYKADEFKAAKNFYEYWDRKRQLEGKSKVARADIQLTEIGSLSDRVDFFDDFLTYEPGDWDTRNVGHLGVRQSDDEDGDIENLEEKEDLEEEIVQQLSNISQLALKGDSLRSNPIVEQCLAQNFYFDSTVIYCVDEDANGVEVELSFKRNGRNAFDLSIKNEYKIKDGDKIPDEFSASFRKRTRREFREAVIDLFGKYKDMPHLMKETGESFGIEDLPRVGPTKAENLEEAGFDTVSKVLNASVEELTDVETMGEGTAKRILGVE